MKLFRFRDADSRFKKIGFLKVEETPSYVEYQREILKPHYIHTISLSHNDWESNVMSYDAHLLKDQLPIGCTCMPLTQYELRLCLKKMQEKGWK